MNQLGNVIRFLKRCDQRTPVRVVKDDPKDYEDFPNVNLEISFHIKLKDLPDSVRRKIML